MTSIEGFDGYGEMLNAMSNRPGRGLPQAQRALTFGSTWVRFDLTRGVLFGRVPTLGEVYDRQIEAGNSRPQATARMVVFQGAVQRGMSLYSETWCKDWPEAEWLLYSRREVWPIEERWWKEAKRFGWDVARCTTACRINLKEAQMALRGAGA